MEKYLAIKDRPGVIPVAIMRQWFESAVVATLDLSTRYTLDVLVDEDETFLRYADDDVQSLWIGFALGNRCYQRFIRANPQAVKDVLNTPVEPSGEDWEGIINAIDRER